MNGSAFELSGGLEEKDKMNKKKLFVCDFHFCLGIKKQKNYSTLICK